jgi:hypothetical protein
MSDITIRSYLSGQHSEQEVADFAIGKLIEQGRPSFGADDGYCKYRGPLDTKCAIGWLIPDDEYQSTMDSFGWTVTSMLDRMGYDQWSEHTEFLQRLQGVHDKAYVDIGMFGGSKEGFMSALTKRAIAFYELHKLVWPFGE